MKNNAILPKNLTPIAGRFWPTIGILCLLMAFFATGCSDDEASPVAVNNMADVNAFVADLNSWPATSASNEGATGNPVEGSDSVNGTDYACVSTPYSNTQTPEGEDCRVTLNFTIEKLDDVYGAP